MKDGIGQLINLIDNFVVKYNAWGTIEQTRSGIGTGFLHGQCNIEDLRKLIEYDITVTCQFCIV